MSVLLSVFVVVALTMKFAPGYVGVGAAPKVIVGLALAMTTLRSADAAVKFVVAAPMARTTQVPAPVDLNVLPLTGAQGPLTALYVSALLSVLVVVALTVKFPPRYMGVGAGPNVIVGVIFAVASTLKLAVTETAPLPATVQGPVPVQPPPQPVNVEPVAGIALRVTELPAENVAEHVVPHAIPAGVLVTVPVPVPVLVTITVSTSTADVAHTSAVYAEVPLVSNANAR